MPKDRTIQQIEIMFSGLDGASAATAMPPLGTLSEILNNHVDKAKKDGNEVFHIKQKEIVHFATAAVEMWHRAIHSFLISTSLTKASPLWASVSGYYSSHYSVRAFAHLLGNFLLYRKHRCGIELTIDKGSFSCDIVAKKGADKEHRYYWRKVKENRLFETNEFFSNNDEGSGPSDIAHRNRANYYDHINRFPQFEILDYEIMKQRVKTISLMPVIDVAIPDQELYPQTETVQLVAYYRLVIFRNFLDDIVLKNRFWAVHRKPSWCPEFLNFQLSNQEFVTTYRDLLVE
jgi:hypothetical protein